MRPLSGASSVPSRCRSVLLPDPDAPTMLRNSPVFTSRFRPFSTRTATACRRYVLLRFSATSIARSSCPAEERQVGHEEAQKATKRRHQKQFILTSFLWLFVPLRG